MLGIHNQPNMMASNVAFKSKVSDLKYDIESERDEKMEQIQQDQADWTNFADNLEKSDSKVAKKASKLVRFGATLLGLAGTFVAAKYGSKMAIETFKSLGKSGTGKAILEGAERMKEPISNGFKTVSQTIKKVAEMPAVKDSVEKLKSSKIGKTVVETLKNEKVAKVLEPVKNTLSSIKDIKFDGKKIQNIIENTMAVTTTGSVLVDDLAGRNNGKSAAELAAGV